jgi:hypothetical protein
MAKRKEGGHRANLVRCYLNDNEYRKFRALAAALNLNSSDLIRREVVHGGLIEADPGKLLALFGCIGAELGAIRALLGEIREGSGLLTGMDSVSLLRLENSMETFHASQESLLRQVRSIMQRLDLKSKPL